MKKIMKKELPSEGNTGRGGGFADLANYYARPLKNQPIKGLSMETIYENSQILVRQNGSSEVFVTNKAKGIEIRVSPDGDATTITTNGIMTPWAVNGLPAIVCYPRPK